MHLLPTVRYAQIHLKCIVPKTGGDNDQSKTQKKAKSVRSIHCWNAVLAWTVDRVEGDETLGTVLRRPIFKKEKHDARLRLSGRKCFGNTAPIIST